MTANFFHRTSRLLALASFEMVFLTPVLASQTPPLVSASASTSTSTSTSTTTDLTGRVTLTLPPSVKLDAGGTVVWIPGLTVDAPEPVRSTMTSKDKRFDPRILAVSAGASIRLPNMDSIYHNAFSLSPGNTFDLGLYRKGASRDVLLKVPGIVRVYCNIHPEMAASVVVVDGNAFAVVKPDGSFRIRGIPSGRREVHLWSDVAGVPTKVEK